MPEITNNFTRGRMNQDLDKKLIPKGEYISATNAQIGGSSDFSGDGVLAAIKGNEIIAANVPTDSVCIGSISDEAKNKLYWFTTQSGLSNDPDCIFEYDQEQNVTTVVFRDVNMNVLKFPNDFITGINIIDDFLFWTDGHGEPKKISISRSIQGTPQAGGHTQLFVNNISLGDILEEHITVIKKKPEEPPTIRVTSSIEDVTLTDDNGNATTVNKSINPIFEKIFPRFAVRYKYVDGEYSAIGPFSDVVFKPKFFENRNADSSYSFKEPYHLSMVNCISAIELANFVPSNIPLDVVQVDLLYMQENSSVVYSIDSVKKTDGEWSLDGVAQGGGDANYPNVFDYSGATATLGNSHVRATGRYEIRTENIYAALPDNQLLRNYDNVPRIAQAQEITGNRIVYANYTQNYDIKDINYNEYTPKLSSTYGLRYNAFETFLEGGLKSVKSQRDYQVGVVFGDEYGRETPVFTSDQSFVTIPWQGSYGLNASQSLLLESSVINGAPNWAKYFKFFVKNTAGEYYNLVMDKAYDPPTQTDFENEDDHIWISFASTDRNKITIDDYIILKKVFDAGNTSSTGQVGVENRFKILDIQNNVPDSISYKYYNLGIAKQGVDANTGDADSFTNQNNSFNSGVQLFFDDNNKPDIALTDTIIMDRGTWAGNHILSPLTGNDGDITAQDFSDNTKGLYISWSASDHPGGIKNSRRYKIVSMDGSGNQYKMKLAEPISDDDSLIARPTTQQTVLTSGNGLIMNPTLQVKVERKERRNYENFSGKFFVKIHGDNLVREKIFDFLAGGEPDDYIIGSFNLFRWADGDGTNSGDDATQEVVNPSQASDTQFDNNTTASHLPSEITTSGSSISNTEQDWQELIDTCFIIDISGVSTSVPGGFIVDEMYLAGSNPHNDSYAKHAGQGWHGADHLYPEQVWRPVAVRGSTGTGVNGFPDFGPAYEGQGTQSTSVNIGSIYGASEGYAGTKVISTNDTTSIANLNNAPAVNPGNLAAHWNAMEGAIQTDNEHTLASGSRRWLDGEQDGLNTTNLDNTYGTVNNKNVVHISFVAPGKDLHNGEGLTTGNIPNNYYFRGSGTSPTYNDVLSVRMQGIWGGGWFSSGSKFGTSSEGFVCFEGNWGPTNTHGYNFGSQYDNEQAGWFQTPAPGQCGVNNNQGYNQAFIQDHEDQWKPNKTTDNTLNAIAEDFLNTMVPGARFRFKDDPDAEVYTILSRKEKHLYNHTPWRQRWIYDGNNFVPGGDSVEEAAIAWANTTTDPSSVGYWRYSGTTSSFVGEWYYGGKVRFPDNFAKASTNSTAWDTLAQRIVDFGKANNRRTCYVFEFDKDIRTVPTSNTFNAYSTDGFDVNDFLNVEIISDNPQVITGEINEKPAIWETEPSQNNELNIYHEVSGNIPLRITADNFELLAPTGCRVEFPNLATADPGFSLYVLRSFALSPGVFNVRDIQGDAANNGFNYLTGADYADQEVRFYRDDGSYTTAIIDGTYPDPAPLGPQGYRSQFKIKLDIDPSKKFGLSYYNTFSFGDGVESSRVRAGFNEMKFTNGPKASATLEEPYETEVRKNGLIYSGIYNSTSGVNNLNQFISAEKITKDINPTYGGITKLFSRKTDLITLCEDRILKILANKDAVFNADGNPQLVASANVLGQAVPFAGDYGCQHAESVDVDNYRLYFADKQRRSVLRLSMDGLTPISDAGMRTWFKENLTGSFILGTYDNDEEEYNLTIGDSELVLTNENIVNNSYFDEGDSFYEVSTLGDIVVDGFAPSGNDLLYAAPSVIEEVPNLNPDVIVINWPEIPAGSINGGQITGIDQAFAPAVYQDGDPTGYGSLDSIYTAFYANSDPYNFNQTYNSDPIGGYGITNYGVNSGITSMGHPFKSGGHGHPLSRLKRYVDGGFFSVKNQLGNTQMFDDYSGSSVSAWQAGAQHPGIYYDWGDITSTTYPGDIIGTNGPEGIVLYGSWCHGSAGGHACEVRFPGNYQNTGSTYQFQSGYSIPLDVKNWFSYTNPNSIPYNANGLNYANVKANTIFAGEEIEVTVQLEYARGAGSGGGPNTGYNSNFDNPFYYNSNNLPVEPDVSFVFYDNTTQLASNTIVDPANYPHQSTITSDFNNPAVNSSATYFTENLGQQGGNPILTNGMENGAAVQAEPNNINTEEYRYLKTFRFQVKFAGGSMTASDYIELSNTGVLEEEQIVVNDLQMGVKVGGNTGNGAKNSVIIKGVAMKKVFKLETPSVPTFNNQVGTGVLFPATTIPAWTQVAPKDLSTSNYSFNNINYAGAGPNSNWRLDPNPNYGQYAYWSTAGFNPYANHVDTYGNFNYPEAINGTDDQGNAVTIYAGDSNGVTDPTTFPNLPTTGNPSAYSNNGGPTPTYGINPTSVTAKVDVGSLTNAAPYNYNTGLMTYNMQTPFQAGDWYYVRAEVNNSAQIPAGDNHYTFIVLEDVVDPTNLNWGILQDQGRRSHASANPSYPDWHFGTITKGNLAHADGSISLYPCSYVSNPTNSIQQYAAIFQFNGSNPNELKFRVGINGASIPNFNIEYIQIRNITNYSNSGGDATSWSSDAPSYVPDFTGIPGYMDFLLFNSDPAVVTWPFETYHHGGKLCFRNAGSNGYDHWYQEFDSANNSNLAPDVPSLQGYKLSFRVHPEPLTGTISGELVARVANKVDDWDVGECAGVRLVGITQTGDYEIYFNFDDGSSFAPYATRNGVAISGVDMFHDLGANWYQGVITQNSISFRGSSSPFTGSVDQIVLEDQTVSFSGGTANSWSLVNNIFNSALTPYITWDNVQENIQLNNLPFPVQSWIDINGVVQNPNGYSYQIEQNIGHISFNNSSLYRFSATINLQAINPATGAQISFSENDIYPEILIYYYNTNGEGFEVYSYNNHNVNYGNNPNISWYLPTGQTNYNNTGSGNVNPVASNGQKIQFDVDGEHMNQGVYFGAFNMNLQQGLGLGLSNTPQGASQLAAGTPGPYLQNTLVIVINGIEGSPVEQYEINGFIDDVEFIELGEFDESEFTTISYKEQQKGWVSFKTFYPENGLSLGSKYYTFKNANLYEHHKTDNWNVFYGSGSTSGPNTTSVKFVLNDSVNICKEFHSLNFKGSHGRSNFFVQNNEFDTDGDNIADLDYANFLESNDHFNQQARLGWSAESIVTDLEEGTSLSFVKKENKWFSDIRGRVLAGGGVNVDNIGVGDFDLPNPSMVGVFGQLTGDINNTFGIGIIESVEQSTAPMDPNADDFDFGAIEVPANLPIQPQVQPQASPVIQPQSPPPPPPSSPSPGPSSGSGSSGGGY